MEQEDTIDRLAPADPAIYRAGDGWYGRRDTDTVGPLGSEHEVRRYLELLDAVQATRDMGPDENAGALAEPVEVS